MRSPQSTDLRLIGAPTKEKCPKCGKGQLLRNREKAEWCSNVNCNHYTRKGKFVVVKEGVYELDR